MNWELKIDQHVIKYLRKVSKEDSRRIYVIIQALVINPYGGDIKKLSDRADTWRRRVGSYRILYEVFLAKRVIHVYDVKRRTSQTY